ncbi:MAG: MFS transporter [Pseudomonadales bacterium]|nr:MFS transporter [Pseudomonadales bacterium]
MSLKIGLILLTLVSVVADTMLLPFYPQFFASEFDQHSPEHVGYYIAACCFTIMVTFPLWARVAKRINELHLWVYTQIAAGVLGISCYFVDSLVGFWVLSQAMLVFKASYLLIYPFVMRLEEKDRHLGVASLFSILMHFGAIGGALVGGTMLEYINPRSVYLIMAGTDALQVIVCLYIIQKRHVAFYQTQPDLIDNPTVETKPEQSFSHTQHGKRYVYTLGIISLLFYCSSFLIRPFFSKYWEAVSSSSNELLAGLIYSIPGWIALIGLWFNHRQKSEKNNYSLIFNSLALALIGVMIQGIENTAAIIIGRCIFGWALFQVTVRLEVVMFELSHKDDYAVDFSKIHIFQNIGVLLASFCVGSIVSQFSLQMPFWISFNGFVITAIVFVLFFRQAIWPGKRFEKGAQSA